MSNAWGIKNEKNIKPAENDVLEVERLRISEKKYKWSFFYGYYGCKLGWVKKLAA